MAWLQEVPPFTQPPQLTVIPPRPKCVVHQVDASDTDAADLRIEQACLPTSTSSSWMRIVECEAPTPIGAWESVMESFVLHPEQNSSNILRADVLFDEQRGAAAMTDEFWVCRRRLIRRLLPRKPGMNAHLDQLCTFYASQKGDQGLVIYTPLILEGQEGTQRDIGAFLDQCRCPASSQEVPFYHPALLSLGFLFDQSPDNAQPVKRLSIALIPFEKGVVPPQLSRVANSLLTTLHRHSWSRWHSYKPRTEHDRLAPRELVQDVYLNLKHRWAKWLVENWREKTSTEKHVHEDLSVAAWLMCFWRQRFAETDSSSVESIHLQDRPWLHDQQTWARPAGGFVDVGCGNGLLVWILNNEGYKGHGFDLRPRKSWDLFRQCTPQGVEVVYPTTDVHERATAPRISVPVAAADLRVRTLDAIAEIREGIARHANTSAPGDHRLSEELWPRHSFLIGNHADELTPLLPLLATSVVHSCSGFVNIPCCAWTVEGKRFTKPQYRVSREEVVQRLCLEPQDAENAKGDHSAAAAAAERVRLEMHEVGLGPAVDAPTTAKGKSATPGANGIGGSRNVAYLAYISHLHLQCGWHVEKEALRMPSTRNWAIVSTKRVSTRPEDEKEVLRCIEAMVDAARDWQARDVKGEGKWFLQDGAAADGGHGHS